MQSIKLGEHVVGPSAPVLIIAEAGVNHNGDVGRAHRMVEAAADAGADVVKFQSFVAEEIVTRAATKAKYQRATTDPSESQFHMLKALELPPAAYLELQEHCAQRGILFLSTPYDHPSVDALDQQGVAGYKISSSDVTNIPLLEHVARKGRPVILSTGMCDLDEVKLAVDTLRAGGLHEFALLHCTSEYPAPIEESNLRVMKTLRETFASPVGFSDHTTGLEVCAWAVAAGACIIEKHFTLDRNLPGPDHRASLEPGEFAQLVTLLRRVERAMGDGSKRPAPSELKNKAAMQKSLVARRPIAAGDRIEAGALACKRPASGLPPRLWRKVVGLRTRRAIETDEVLTADSIEWE